MWRKFITITCLIVVVMAREYRICELLFDLNNAHNVPSLEAAQIACAARFFTELRTDFQSTVDGRVHHGVFGISNCCNSTCNAFLDADISDDLECTRSTGEFRTLPKYSENNCEKRAKNYILDCFGNSRDRRIDALAPSTERTVQRPTTTASTPFVTYRAPTRPRIQRRKQTLTNTLQSYFTTLDKNPDRNEWINVLNHRFGLSIREIFETSCLAYDSISCRQNYGNCQLSCSPVYGRRCEEILRAIDAALTDLNVNNIENFSVLNTCSHIDDLTAAWEAQNYDTTVVQSPNNGFSPITDSHSNSESTDHSGPSAQIQSESSPQGSTEGSGSITSSMAGSTSKPSFQRSTSKPSTQGSADGSGSATSAHDHLRPEASTAGSTSKLSTQGSTGSVTSVHDQPHPEASTEGSTSKPSSQRYTSKPSSQRSTSKPFSQGSTDVSGSATSAASTEGSTEKGSTLSDRIETSTAPSINLPPPITESTINQISSMISELSSDDEQNTTNPDSLGLIVNHCELLSFFNSVTQITDEQVVSYLCFSYDILWCTMNKNPETCSTSCAEADEMIRGDPLCTPFLDSIKSAGIRLRDSGVHKFNEYNANCRKGAWRFIQECKKMSAPLNFTSIIQDILDGPVEAASNSAVKTFTGKQIDLNEFIKTDTDNLSLMESQFPAFSSLNVEAPSLILELPIGDTEFSYESSSEVTVPEISTELSVPEVSPQVADISTEFSPPEISSEVTVPEISTELSVPEVSSQVADISTEISPPETSSEVTVPEISTKTLLPEVSTELSLPEVSTELPEISPEATQIPEISSEVPSETPKTSEVTPSSVSLKAPIIGYRLNEVEKSELPLECKLLNLLGAMNLTKPETVSYLCLAYGITWCTQIDTRENCDAACPEPSGPECEEKFQAIVRVGQQMKTLLDINDRQDFDCPIGTLKFIRGCQDLDPNLTFATIEALPARINLMNIPTIPMEESTEEPVTEVPQGTSSPSFETVEPTEKPEGEEETATTESFEIPTTTTANVPNSAIDLLQARRTEFLQQFFTNELTENDQVLPDVLQKDLCQLYLGLQKNPNIENEEKRQWFCFSYNALSCYLDRSTDCSCTTAPEFVRNSSRCPFLMEHVAKLASQLATDLRKPIKWSNCTENFDTIVKDCTSIPPKIPITTYHPIMTRTTRTPTTPRVSRQSKLSQDFVGIRSLSQGEFKPEEVESTVTKVKEEVMMLTNQQENTTDSGDFYRLSIFNSNTTSSLNFTVNLDKLSIRDIIFTPVSNRKDFNVTFRIEQTPNDVVTVQNLNETSSK